MNRILILGALPKGNQDRQKLYETIVSVCNNYADEVNSPIDTESFKGSDPERYERAFRMVKEADYILGELSEPSTGQGMEIRESTHLDKPLLIVAKTGSKVSGLVKQCPNLQGIVNYDSLKDLESKLYATISQALR